MCVNWELIGAHGAVEWFNLRGILTNLHAHRLVEKSPFQVAAKRFERRKKCQRLCSENVVYVRRRNTYIAFVFENTLAGCEGMQ